MSIKLKQIKATEVNKIHKATVHISGKLGFTRDAAELLDLSHGKSAKIMVNEGDESDKNLYVTIINDQDDGDSFKISKAGEYYYINLKYFYKNQGEDYISKSIGYYITRTKIDGEDYFLFERKDDNIKIDDDDE